MSITLRGLYVFAGPHGIGMNELLILTVLIGICMRVVDLLFALLEFLRFVIGVVHVINHWIVIFMGFGFFRRDKQFLDKGHSASEDNGSAYD